VIVFVARVGLGAVFVASGLLKVRDREWPAVARAFGAPGWAVPVLPWAEVVVGALLGAQLWPAALVAAALLAVFTGAAAGHLARGHRVPCGCFGSAVSSRPIGPGTIARNLVLLAVAVVAVL
jgi:uncharacterized membrane protein YphA (DoxX/SURF4 family)